MNGQQFAGKEVLKINNLHQLIPLSIRLAEYNWYNIEIHFWIVVTLATDKQNDKE